MNTYIVALSVNHEFHTHICIVQEHQIFTCFSKDTDELLIGGEEKKEHVEQIRGLVPLLIERTAVDLIIQSLINGTPLCDIKNHIRILSIELLRTLNNEGLGKVTMQDMVRIYALSGFINGLLQQDEICWESAHQLLDTYGLRDEFNL